MTKRKSMRGVEIDVDLIRMKQQLMDGKKTEPNIKREDYVSDRRRRSSSKRIDEMFANEQVVRQKIAAQKLSETSTVTEEVKLVTPPVAVTPAVLGVTEAAILEDATPVETPEVAGQPKGRTVRKNKG